MLKLYISNRIENLSRQFAENINTTSDVFARELIISQTSGMERWLSLQAAQQNGIFTNFEFVKPNTFVNRLYQLADLKANDIYSTENLKWIIYQLLDEDAFKTAFPQVSEYYLNDDIKKLQLSVKIADLFDQYLLYRQNYIEAWSQNKKAVVQRQKDDTDKQYQEKQERLDQHQKWQMWLWLRIKATIKEDNLDKVQLKSLFKQKLQDEAFKSLIQSHYSRISLFGLSIITDYHIEIFHYLSELIDVHLYFLNPSPETYWYDIVNEKFVFYLEQKTGKTAQELKMHIGNELLGNNSGLAKDTFNILFRHDAFIDAIEDFRAEAPEPKHLLGKIQNDIYNNLHHNKNCIEEQDLKDNSLIISSSYTMAREVEALYNQLLWFFKNDAELQPHDVIVQLSDVDAYTPYIRAVFDNAPYALPYTIADRSYAGGDNLLGALESLLEMRFEDFTSENVIQLLNSEFICKPFGIHNIDLIRQAVNQANIRFGIKGYKQDDSRYVSWTFGLERLILGYAISGGEAYALEDDTTYPLDTIEGSDMEEIFRFKHFVDQLIQLIEQRNSDRSIVEWGEYTLNLIDQLLWVDDSSSNEIRYIRKHIESFGKMSQWFHQDISYDVYKKSLLDALFSNPRAGHFINGSITFCSMIPMRSIPFKVVAMLGLNGDTFPRQDSKIAFNLMDVEYQRGDRNTKNNDKYLFLETLLSARQHLYLSYIGKSTSDNTDLPPSILIEELQRYIALSCNSNKSTSEIEKSLIVQHPLHGFSKKYNNQNPSLFNFDINPVVTLDKPPTIAAAQPTELASISIEQWYRFFADPFKYYYNQVLKVYYEEAADLIAETEMFAPNPLEAYTLKQELIHLNDEDFDHFVDKGKKQGALPLAHMGKIIAREYSEAVQTVRSIFRDYTQAYTPSSEMLVYQTKNTEIKGKLYPVYNKQHIHISVSSKTSEKKHLMQTYLSHLIIMACEKDIDTVFISINSDKAVVFKKDLIKSADAQAIVQKLLEYRRRGLQDILAFMPDVAYQLVEDTYRKFGDDDKIAEYQKRAVLSIKNKGVASSNHVLLNPYIKREVEDGFFEKPEQLTKELSEVSWLIFGDLIKLGIL